MINSIWVQCGSVGDCTPAVLKQLGSRPDESEELNKFIRNGQVMARVSLWKWVGI